MANDLTNLIPHIEALRARLSQTANTEHSLVEQLSDALKRFDQETLQGIRNVASEHDARRSGILHELQALAGRIGTFLPAREAVEPAIQQHDTPARGDWRQAVKKISYHDELEADLHALLTEGSRH